MKKLFAILLLAFAATTGARAADMAETPYGFSWEGSYAGIFAGYGWGDSTHTQLGVTTSFDLDGGLVGITGGHNWQRGNIVYGIEIDAAWSGIDGSTTVLCSTVCYTEIDFLATLRGRLGVAVNNWLFYGTAGIALAAVDAGLTAQPAAASETEFGWVAGLGAEVALNPAWSVKAEVLFVGLDDTPYGFGLINTDQGTLTTARIGLNYHFGSM
ncbi:MAG: outer membrane protein [Flavobacteriaceae bacterium]